MGQQNGTVVFGDAVKLRSQSRHAGYILTHQQPSAARYELCARVVGPSARIVHRLDFCLCRRTSCIASFIRQDLIR